MLPFWYPPVLTYHRIGPHPDGSTVTPKTFALQMKLLSQYFNPIPLEKLFSALEGKETLPGRGVVVTFDDGTQDAYAEAFPILSKYAIPATVFMIAGHVGSPGSLNKTQIREMNASGIDFGSHSLGHEYLPSIPASQAREAIVSSRKRLQELGLPVEAISYPAGGFTPEVIRFVQEAGYRGACTTNRGFRRFPIDRWALRRISMHESSRSALDLILRLSGFYGINRKLRSPA